MSDYEENRERNENNAAQKAALGALIALGGVAWSIAQNVLIDRGTQAANDFINDRMNKKKK